MKPNPSCKSATFVALAALLPAIFTTGCATGPTYTRPDAAPPAAFRSQLPATEAGSIADTPWWGVFNDDALQRLIAQSLAANLDIQVAVARIEQARALVAVAHSQYAPQLGYQAAAGGENDVRPGREIGWTPSAMGPSAGC